EAVARLFRGGGHSSLLPGMPINRVISRAVAPAGRRGRVYPSRRCRVTRLAVMCGSCQHAWAVVSTFSIYEQQALESCPCPAGRRQVVGRAEAEAALLHEVVERLR